MYKRFIAVALVAGLALPLSAAQLGGAVATTPSPQAFTPSIGVPDAEGFTFPIDVVSVDQGAFQGKLQIVRFATDVVADGSERLIAVGLVSGTLTDEAGEVSSIFRTVRVPVNIVPGGPVRKGQVIGACDVLHLELGPLDLDLLGLVVHLNQVVLDIDAVPGAGALLGNLLCAITNLLNGPGALLDLANLLNQLLAILT